MTKGYSKTIILMFWLKEIQQQVKWFLTERYSTASKKKIMD